ncbi:SDR family NAD(P)-dependent oxidoreductase [Cellulomonas triticagri]|uniref:SDR family oxidoreductase n=1 Tax=Cellulomonas triticagri TaxID=2483352 RepID=A0A3M2J3N1_9CELL|nr:SDR family NAD(P)-dependent oxidoreductase [Cellulomonas triticagri]RMI05168.1 SDR family oxidoreductase [Cellulomonas triticagri]
MTSDTPAPAPTTALAAPRTALVTGAGRGIGRGIALGLVRAGWDVALLGRTASHLEAVAAEARALRPEARVVVRTVDVVDADAVTAAVRDVEDAFADQGGIGLLVNNAGVIERQETDLVTDDVEDVWRVVETNVRGPLLLSHAVLPAMLARGAGRVVNINSGSGHRPSPVYTGYGISKGALARLTTMLDRQYAARGIRVLDLAPGVVVTDMTQAMPLHDQRDEWTPVEATVDLVDAFGSGRLDALSGRFVRAGTDTEATLLAVADRIEATDARTLRLAAYGEDDPVA